MSYGSRLNIQKLLSFFASIPILLAMQYNNKTRLTAYLIVAFRTIQTKNLSCLTTNDPKQVQKHLSF